MPKTITVYSPAELKEVNPEGFERAHERYIDDQLTDILWTDEIMESLKGIIKATSGMTLKDWSISGDYPSSSWITLSWSNDDARDLHGNRALAWLENNLLADLRISNRPMFTRSTLPDGTVTEYQPTKRGDLSQYGKYYRAGMIKPCPFTGYCADDDFIESLLKDIKAGHDLGSAYGNLAKVAGKLFEQEMEYARSDEHFLEQDHLEYTEEGRLV